MSFGSLLPDQVDTLDHRTDAQLVLLADVQALVRERAAIEVQYSKSLQATAKKAEKLVQTHMPAAALGDNPSKQTSEDVLARSTLFAALSFLAETFDRSAQEHLSFSEVLNIQVADDLKALEKKKEETRKKHSSFYTKLMEERDAVYNGRIKAQSKYYENCGEVESSRQKQDRATDDKHAQRATKQFEEAQTAMLDAKNTFLINISVSNKTKDRFYSQSVPEIEDQYQLLQTSITSRLTYILSNYCSFNSSHLSTLAQTVSGLQTKITAVNHEADDELFAEFNRRPFSLPPDWDFEPCPAFYDTPTMSIDPEPKVYLQNKLARARSKLSEITPVLKAKETEANRLKDLSVKYAADPNLGSADTALDNAFEAFHAASQLELSQTIHQEEVRIISEAVGDDTGGNSPHSFKASSFAVPTTCGYCQGSIWGLTKQGKTCKVCGLTVHAKCELKVPAECSGKPAAGAPVTVSRHRSTASKGKIAPVSTLSSTTLAGSTPLKQSVSSSSSTTSTHSFAKSQGTHLTSPNSSTSSGSSSSPPDGKILFDFQASSTFELTVKEGRQVWIVEDDEDGSGWLKVSDGAKTGLVPTTYLEMLPKEVKKKKAAPPPPARGGAKGKKVRGLYDYEAQGDDELSISEGGVYTLTPHGDTYADGWFEGMDSRGNKGIFPSNYVELI